MELESEPFLSPNPERPLQDIVPQRRRFFSHARVALHEKGLFAHFVMILLYAALTCVLIQVNRKACGWVPANGILTPNIFRVQAYPY